MREEKKIVTRSLVILFLSLTIVYALAYMRKTDIFTAGQDTQTLDEVSTQLETGNQNTDTAIIDITAMTPNNATGTIWTTGNSSPQSSWENLSNITVSSNATGLASTESITLLPDTSQFFGVLDIVDVLGVQPDYMLQDAKGNYFASYGKKGLDFVRTVQQLGGNVYTMSTESEILQNELFGEKVSFINMVAFKTKFVLMVIEIEGNTWLLQIPADKYYTSKSYLKSLFIY